MSKKKEVPKYVQERSAGAFLAILGATFSIISLLDIVTGETSVGIFSIFFVSLGVFLLLVGFVKIYKNRGGEDADN